uniref:UPF0160 protein MYG1, mitochondrial n=1 Tax=Strongyloides stercoralis TaxID=6248 RepID=A0A0K0E8Q9_STRER
MHLKLFPQCFNLRSVFYLRGITTIGTHNGKFHTDEALACFFLKSIPEFRDAKIIRSRNMEILEKSDVVVDVGGIYNHEKRRYDHHQRTFNETMRSLNVLSEYNTKLSSAGLIYAHYGKKVISEILNISMDDHNLDLLFNKMYMNFVESIDAIDNGISCYDCPPKFVIPESIDSRVNDLLPYWNSTEVNDENFLNEQFLKAVELVGVSFTEKLKKIYYSWLPARNIVKDAIEKRFSVHSSGQIIHFQNGGMPWKTHIIELEKNYDINENDISFVVYEDKINKRYKIQGIPARNSNDSFTNRAALKKEWRGLDREKLIELSGISDIEFVHASGFIGGADSFDSVIEMGIRSLN